MSRPDAPAGSYESARHADETLSEDEATDLALRKLAFGLSGVDDPTDMGVVEVAVRAIERVDELEERVEELESGGSSGGGSGPVGPDARDQAVIDALAERGVERVNVGMLKNAYRSETDVRTKSTLESRVESLTISGPFELEKPGVWRFTGGDGDE